MLQFFDNHKIVCLFGDKQVQNIPNMNRLDHTNPARKINVKVEYEGVNPFARPDRIRQAISLILSKDKQNDGKLEFRAHLNIIKNYLENIQKNFHLESTNSSQETSTMVDLNDENNLAELFDDQIETNETKSNFEDNLKYLEIIENDINKNHVYGFIDQHPEIKTQINQVLDNSKISLEKYHQLEINRSELNEFESELINLKGNILPESAVDSQDSDYYNEVRMEFDILFNLVESIKKSISDSRSTISHEYNELVQNILRANPEILTAQGSYGTIFVSQNNSYYHKILEGFRFDNINSAKDNLQEYFAQSIGNFYINLFYRTQLNHLLDRKEDDKLNTLDIEKYISRFGNRDEGIKILGETLLKGDNFTITPYHKLDFVRFLLKIDNEGALINLFSDDTKFKLLEKFLEPDQVILEIPDVLVNFIKAVDISQVPDYIRYRLDVAFIGFTDSFYKLDKKFREIFLNSHKEAIEGDPKTKYAFDPRVYAFQNTFKSMILDDPDNNHLYEFITKHFNPIFRFPRYDSFSLNDNYFKLLCGYMSEYPFNKNKALMKLYIHPNLPNKSDQAVIDFDGKYNIVHKDNLKRVYEEYIDNLWSKARELIQFDPEVNDENYPVKYETLFEQLKAGGKSVNYKSKRAQEIYEYFSPRYTVLF